MAHFSAEAQQINRCLGYPLLSSSLHFDAEPDEATILVIKLSIVKKFGWFPSTV
jgi:hypothetical protein